MVVKTSIVVIWVKTPGSFIWPVRQVTLHFLCSYKNTQYHNPEQYSLKESFMSLENVFSGLSIQEPQVCCLEYNSKFFNQMKRKSELERMNLTWVINILFSSVKANMMQKISRYLIQGYYFIRKVSFFACCYSITCVG
jgi:hypothetical protein